MLSPQEEEKDDPFAILHSATSMGGGGSGGGRPVPGQSEDHSNMMDFDEFVVALVRVAVWKAHSAVRAEPCLDNVGRVVGAVAALDLQPRSHAAMDVSRRKQQALKKDR